jgi:hypothetical protein
MADKTPSEDFESWENQTDGRHIIKKFGAKGDLIDDMINARRKFHLTTQERHINQERAADDTLDPFANGIFAPVRLLETAEDFAQISSNPNVMGEDEMKKLVKGNIAALEARLAEVRNPVVLQRLLEVADSEDITVKKLGAIQGRLQEVSPSLYVEVQSAVSK